MIFFFFQIHLDLKIKINPSNQIYQIKLSYLEYGLFYIYIWWCMGMTFALQRLTLIQFNELSALPIVYRDIDQVVKADVIWKEIFQRRRFDLVWDKFPVKYYAGLPVCPLHQSLSLAHILDSQHLWSRDLSHRKRVNSL